MVGPAPSPPTQSPTPAAGSESPGETLCYLCAEEASGGGHVFLWIFILCVVVVVVRLCPVTGMFSRRLHLHTSPSVLE